ncbi:MAG: hypothetical protein ACJ8AS_04395 [Hyphomicrobiales bacterium]
MISDPVELKSPCARALVYRTAALFSNVGFRLPSGRWVEPFAKPPWPDHLDPEIPGHLRRLGGEFFCLPFGGGGATRDPLPGWEALAAGPVDVPMHGPSANADWDILEARSDCAILALDYPETSPVRRIERQMSLAPDRPEARVTVWIEARRPARLPAAFHPILRLPEKPGALAIEASFACGFTYPGIIEPDRMATEPGRRFQALAEVPRRLGGYIDLSRLPLGPPTEDVVLLAGMAGPVRAVFIDEGFELEIDWSREALPHCMLWIHDRGLDDKPWSGRYRGLGVEPLAAAFDGPVSLSAGPNPLAGEGFSTALIVAPDQPSEISLTLRVKEAPNRK